MASANRLSRFLIALVCFGAIAVARPADAGFITYAFLHILEPGDGPGALHNGDLGEAYLFVDVTADGLSPGYVKFTFRNEAPSTQPLYIDGVYFDDGALLGISTIENGPGVSYSVGAKPSDLPGGSQLDPDFDTTSYHFAADADAPRTANGVDGGEYVSVIFQLQNNKTWQDAIDALENALDPTFDNWGEGQDLRIGLKVQGYSDGGSESFVNGPEVPKVPEPSSVALLLAAGATCGTFRLRRRGNSASRGGV